MRAGAAPGATHFGGNATSFLARDVFAELLYTLDSPLLVRDGRVLDPTQFAGPEARDLELIHVFYTQGIDLLTVLRVRFQLQGAKVASGFTVLHYPSIQVPWAVTGLGWCFWGWVVALGCHRHRRLLWVTVRAKSTQGRYYPKKHTTQKAKKIR